MELISAPLYELLPDDVRLVEHDDDGLSYIWFAQRNGETRYVTLTRNDGNSEIYLERDDQKWTATRGIVKVALDARQLTIWVDEQAAQALGGVSQIVVHCQSLDESTRARLITVLHTVFSNSAIPFTIAASS